MLTLLMFSAGLVLFGDEQQSEKRNGIVVHNATATETRRNDGGNRKQAYGGEVGLSRQTNSTNEEQHEILAIHPRISGVEMTEAFVTRNWTPPPPIISPPPPTAPPLPFSFLGKKFENGKWEVFLGLQDNTYVVRDRDVLNQHYTIDAIHPPTMTITYTPLQQQQVLAIGDAP